MKRLETAEWIDTLSGLIRDGHQVRLEISGGSMLPFLAGQRDSVILEQPRPPLHRGDMVCYRRRSGQFVLHRICSVRADGYYLAGDAQSVLEGPVTDDQIVGLVTSVFRKDRHLSPRSFLWRVFSQGWSRMLPLRQPILAAYQHLKHL